MHSSCVLILPRKGERTSEHEGSPDCVSGKPISSDDGVGPREGREGRRGKGKTGEFNTRERKVGLDQRLLLVVYPHKTFRLIIVEVKSPNREEGG